MRKWAAVGLTGLCLGGLVSCGDEEAAPPAQLEKQAAVTKQVKRSPKAPDAAEVIPFAGKPDKSSKEVTMGQVNMGPFAEVFNKADGKKYFISTARNPYGVWETAVAEGGRLGIPNFARPLLVVNTDSKKEARKAHAQIVHIVANRPRREWKKSYSAVGQLPGFQKILEEQNDQD